MAFMNNGQFGGNNQQNGNKKKENFKLGTIWGSDARMQVTTWVSASGVRTILCIEQAIGKDPSGSVTYEQKAPNEIPRFFMHGDMARAIVEAVKDKDPGSLSISIDKGGNNKLTIQGQGNTIRITIEQNKLGSRTMTLESIPVGMTNIHAGFLNLIDLINIGRKKALYNKVDKDEFGVVLTNNDDDNIPFD